MPTPISKQLGLWVFSAITVLGSLVVATFTATSISGQTGTFTTVYATSTVGAPTVNASSTQVSGTVNAGTVSTTHLVIGQGATINGSHTAIVTMSPDAVSAGVCTSSAVALTGAVSGNGVLLTLPTLWTTSTVSGAFVTVSGFANVATVEFCNNSSSTYTFTPGQSLRLTTIEY